MQTSRGPTLDETIAFIKRGAAGADKSAAKQHLENLLYIKSVLYLDDKNNDKHLQRIHAVLESMKKEYSKELSEVAPAEGTIYLVALILAANKIIDAGIARIKGTIERGAIAEREQDAKMTSAPPVESASGLPGTTISPVVAAVAFNAQEAKDNPKLRETLGFLASIVGDPLRPNNKLELHLSNLEKISKLTKRDYQDPKVQKINENILGILGKIFGCTNRREITQAMENSLKILKNLSQYKTQIGLFEADVKNYLLQAQAERGEEAVPSPRQAHVEKFYAEFKDERNMVKKINMAKTVLTSPAYKYDRELNAASLKLLKGLEGMGLQVDVPDPTVEKRH